MKGLMLIALALGTVATASPAAADQVVVQRTTTIQRHTDHRESGWHAANVHRKHRVCRTRWVHHRRVRNCFWR